MLCDTEFVYLNTFVYFFVSSGNPNVSVGMRGHDLHAEADVMVHPEGEIMSDDEELITRERYKYDDEAPQKQMVNTLTYTSCC